MTVQNSLYALNKKNLQKNTAKLRELNSLEAKTEISKQVRVRFQIKKSVSRLRYASFTSGVHALPVHFVNTHLTHPGSSAVSGFSSTLARLLDEKAALHVQFLGAGSDLPVPHRNWRLREIMAQLQKQKIYVEEIAHLSAVTNSRYKTICFCRKVAILKKVSSGYILIHHILNYFVTITKLIFPPPRHFLVKDYQVFKVNVVFMID